MNTNCGIWLNIFWGNKSFCHSIISQIYFYDIKLCTEKLLLLSIWWETYYNAANFIYKDTIGTNMYHVNVEWYKINWSNNSELHYFQTLYFLLNGCIFSYIFHLLILFSYGLKDSLSIFSSAVFINTCIIIPKEMCFSTVIFIMHLFLFLLQKNNFLSFFVTGCNRRYLIWNKSLLFYFVVRIDISSETSQQE